MEIKLKNMDMNEDHILQVKKVYGEVVTIVQYIEAFDDIIKKSNTGMTLYIEKKDLNKFQKIVYCVYDGFELIEYKDIETAEEQEKRYEELYNSIVGIYEKEMGGYYYRKN